MHTISVPSRSTLYFLRDDSRVQSAMVDATKMISRAASTPMATRHRLTKSPPWLRAQSGTPGPGLAEEELEHGGCFVDDLVVVLPGVGASGEDDELVGRRAEWVEGLDLVVVVVVLGPTVEELREPVDRGVAVE